METSLSSATGNFKIGGMIYTILGFFNATCSLGIIFLYWQLRLFKRPSFMTYLVFATTIFQLLQDVALGYKFLCPKILWWTEDAWLTGKNLPLKCNGSSWLIEMFSGMMLQFLTLFMCLVVLYVVYFGRKLQLRKIMTAYVTVSFIMSMVFGSLDVWGAYYCTLPTSWKCPDVKDRDKWSPGNVGWYGGEAIRISVAFLSLLVILVVLSLMGHRKNSSGKGTAGSLTYVLAKRVLLYPVAQCVCRLPAIYIFMHQGLMDVDEEHHEAGMTPDEAISHLRTRLAGYYIMVTLAPMGGLFSLLIFIYVNEPVQRWFRLLFSCGSAEARLEQKNAEFESQKAKISRASSMQEGQLHPAHLIHKLDEDEIIHQIDAHRRQSEGLGIGGGGEEEMDHEMFPSHSLRTSDNPMLSTAGLQDKLARCHERGVLKHGGNINTGNSRRSGNSTLRISLELPQRRSRTEVETIRGTLNLPPYPTNVIGPPRYANDDEMMPEPERRDSRRVEAHRTFRKFSFSK